MIKINPELFQEIIKKMPAAIAMLDRDLNYIAVSERWILDYNLDENIIDRNHYDIFKNIPEKWKQIHSEVLKTGVSQNHEADCFLDNNGNKTFIRWEVTPWLDENNHIGGLLFKTQDRTDELNNLELLKKSQELAKLGSWDFNLADGKINWSEQMFEIFPEDIKNGEPDFEKHKQTIHPDDCEHWEQVVSKAIVDGDPYVMKFRVVHPKKVVWVEAHGEAKRNLDGEIVGLYGTCQDITESELIKSELDQLNEELREFTYRTSHDLKSPLTSTMGVINLIKEDFEDLSKEEILDYINEIEDQHTRLVKTINDVLDVNKTAFHKLNLETLNIINFEKELLNVFKFQLQTKRIQLIFETDLQEIETDLNMFRNIFENLISNSIKYYDKEKTSFIKVSLQKNLDFLQVTIEDNGIGIEEKYHPEIFKMFKRFNVDIEGTGLGLYMIKKQVEKLKGSISFQSVVNKGTCFNIILPLVKS